MENDKVKMLIIDPDGMGIFDAGKGKGTDA
jgi:hypothetical protein